MAKDEAPPRDLFDVPASRILLHLVRTGPIERMHDFTGLSGLSPANARQLRLQLIAYGWIRVGKPERPSTTDMEISITPEGRKVVEVLEKLEEATERAKRRSAAAEKKG